MSHINEGILIFLIFSNIFLKRNCYMSSHG